MKEVVLSADDLLTIVSGKGCVKSGVEITLEECDGEDVRALEDAKSEIDDILSDIAEGDEDDDSEDDESLDDDEEFEDDDDEGEE